MPNALLHVLVVLVFAKLAAELSERAGLPVVVGEIVAGIVVGPSALGLVGDDQFLRVLGELGAVLLLLEVGLQMDVRELAAVGGASVRVAVIGVVAPFAGGWLVASWLGLTGSAPMFVGAALTATSVGITARVFSDLRALGSVEGRTVIGAAVADDVIGLVLLTVVVGIASGGDVSALAVARVVGVAVAFLVVTALLGGRFAPPVFGLVQRHARASGTLVALGLAVALGFAELATLAGLAAIVGAFVAGISLSRVAAADELRRDLAPVSHLFVPVFFLQIGLDARLSAFTRPDVLALAGALLGVAVVGKVVAGLGVLGRRGDRLLVGLGMIPRGEVGLIFAGLGLRSGVLGTDAYAGVLLVVLLTTLVTPPLLRLRLLRRQRAAASTAPALPRSDDPVWDLRDDVVDLVAAPHPARALPVAFTAAMHCATRRPGPALLDWLASAVVLPARWDDAARAAFFALLRSGGARSWRFLEVTGTLDQSLPELATAIRRRRGDASVVDPVAALQWSLVDEVRRVSERDPVAARHAGELPHPERVLLAALVLDCAAGGTEPAVVLARRVVQRLDLGAAVEQDVAALVQDAALMRAAAGRPRSLTEESVLELAAHLGSAERARALYVLSVARGELEAWEREQLDVLHQVVQQALAHPELTGRAATNTVEQRRAKAAALVGDDTAAQRRVATAPRGYLLAHAAEDVARHVALLEPLPDRGDARVRARPHPDGWEVDVVARDRSGLLACVTSALATTGHNVRTADVATWPDGVALDSFVVSGPAMGESAIAAAVRNSFATPLASIGVTDAVVTFDDEASPWYTLVEVQAADRPGLLHVLATALASCGADIHAARAATVFADARDTFSVTDRRGEKLDDATKAAVVTAIRVGVRQRRRWAGAFGTRWKHAGHGVETTVA
ncbi:MAG: cation:proton antiporter [Mycobacteriales bacterium]|nr:cation:proton antiporter [Frankia sp.]